MSDSLRPHESQHARPPYPSPAPGVHSDARPSSQWCHPAISSSAPNPSQHQSLFQWVNSSNEVAKVLTGVSALASFLPKKSQGWSPSEWTGWISLQSKRLSGVFFGNQGSDSRGLFKKDHVIYLWVAQLLWAWITPSTQWMWWRVKPPAFPSWCHSARVPGGQTLNEKL